MNDTVSSTTAAPPDKVPYGKVVGIVRDRDQLNAIFRALTTLGAQETEVMGGSVGVSMLDKEEDDVARCFLGDTEKDMVHRYLNAAREGLLVFTVAVEPREADLVARTAKSLGALDVAYFGTWAITSY